jgi:hypothetical protein
MYRVITKGNLFTFAISLTILHNSSYDKNCVITCNFTTLRANLLTVGLHDDNMASRKGINN